MHAMKNVVDAFKVQHMTLLNESNMDMGASFAMFNFYVLEACDEK